MRSRAIAIVLTVGSLCWVAAAQETAPAKELLQWVSDARKAGRTESQIQTSASAAGWPEGAVNEALRMTAPDAAGKPKPAEGAGEPAKENPATSNPAAGQPPAAATPPAGDPAGGTAKPAAPVDPAAITPKPADAGSPTPSGVPAATGSPIVGSPAVNGSASPTGGTPAAGDPAAGIPKSAAERGVPDDYQIGAGDALHISVYHELDASVPSVVVRPDGRISMPILKEVMVLGLTPSQLEKQITAQLTKFITAPDVTVIVTAINSKKIYAIGAVKKEGPIPFTYRMTVMQALSEAGGLTDYAKRKKIYVLHTENGREFIMPFNYDAVLKGEHMEKNYLLSAGDTIVVPH
jgi:polysaccharide export outer membrane protein